MDLMLLTTRRETLKEEDSEDILHESLKCLQKQIDQDRSRFSNVKVVPKIVSLLRELVLTHRWTDLVHALSVFSSNIEAIPQIFFKLSFEVFYQQRRSTNLVLFKKFVEEIKVLKEYDCNEVVLEYCLFLLISCQQEYDSSLLVKVAPRPKYKFLDKKSYFENLIQGYEGLVHYVEWCKLKCKLDAIHGENTCTGYNSLQQDKQQMLIEFERASECFKAIEKHNGVWNIFMSKHVTMLEYHGSKMEAEEVLKTYLQKYPDDPFSLNLLYEFYERNNFDLELKIRTLEKLCHIIPYGSCVLTLCDLYKLKSDGARKSLPLLFTLLDYAEWKQNSIVWKSLVTDIQEVYKSKYTCIVKEMWEQRKDWWIPYQFTYQDHDSSDLLYLKTICAIYLISTDADYIKEVLESGKLDKSQISNIEEVQMKRPV